jgi:hypothetical protein
MAMAYTHPFTVDSIAMSEGVVRRVLYQSLLALHHLHTAHGDRPVVVHRAISPEKRELRYPLTSRDPDLERQIDSFIDSLLTVCLLSIKRMNQSFSTVITSTISF